MDDESRDVLEQLSGFSTPTIVNAIDTLGAGDPTLGFSDGFLRNMFERPSVVVGQVMTVEIETMNPFVENPGPGPLFIELLQKVDASPVPVIVVAHEVGTSHRYGAHCGEVIATSLEKVGAAAIVTDAGVRDVEHLKNLSLRVYARGVVPSSGNARLVRLGNRVELGGLLLNEGDLVHGDESGLVRLPTERLADIARAAEAISQAEQGIINFINSDSYSLRRLIELLSGGAG